MQLPLHDVICIEVSTLRVIQGVLLEMKEDISECVCVCVLVKNHGDAVSY